MKLIGEPTQSYNKRWQQIASCTNDIIWPVLHVVWVHCSEPQCAVNMHGQTWELVLGASRRIAVTEDSFLTPPTQLQYWLFQYVSRTCHMTESPVNWVPLVSSGFLNSLYFIFKTVSLYRHGWLQNHRNPHASASWDLKAWAAMSNWVLNRWQVLTMLLVGFSVTCQCFFQKKVRRFPIMCMCVGLCTWTQVCLGQKWVPDPLLWSHTQVVVNHPEYRLRSSARAVCVLSAWANALAPQCDGSIHRRVCANTSHPPHPPLPHCSHWPNPASPCRYHPLTVCGRE